MAIALQVDRDRHLFVETFRGTIDVEQIEASNAQKERVIEGRIQWACLSDLRDCQLRLTEKQIRIVAAATAKLHGGPAALAVDSDLNYALARQYQAYRESYTGMGSVKVFREFDDANAWMRQKTRSGSIQVAEPRQD